MCRTQWYSNGKLLPKAPRTQTLGFRQTLLNKLRDRGLRDIQFLAVAVAFPDTPFSTPPTHGDLEGAMLGQQDLRG